MPIQGVGFQTRGREFGKKGKPNITIQEERQFTNPAVRFVTIRGRVVPIVNRKRVGQMAAGAGTAAIVGGTALVGLGLGKRKAKKIFTAMKRSKTGRFLRRETKFGVASSPLGIKVGNLLKKRRRKLDLGKIKRKSTFTTRLAKGAARGAINTLRFTSKHPLKIGLGLIGAGVGARFVGTGFEAASPFGFDVFPSVNPDGK